MEVIIALGVGIIIVTAMVSLAVFTLRTSTVNERLVKGTRLTNQQLERARALRDDYITSATWEDFYLYASGLNCTTDCSDAGSCYINDGISLVEGLPAASDGITSCIYFETVSGNTEVINVIAVSTWEIGGETKFTHNYSQLSNWSVR
ncbi:hypothetical protein GF360_03780 [candidate division WWE3 bacterium]|nr:hypothetical protein [candidate division WWE3 bacterium]